MTSGDRKLKVNCMYGFYQLVRSCRLLLSVQTLYTGGVSTEVSNICMVCGMACIITIYIRYVEYVVCNMPEHVGLGPRHTGCLLSHRTGTCTVKINVQAIIKQHPAFDNSPRLPIIRSAYPYYLGRR